MINKHTESGYRWYILILAALTHTFTVAVPLMSLPVLFEEISGDLNLTLVQIGLIWGIGSLSGIVAGLVGGPLGDRFGAKRTLTVACVLAGTTGALRGFSADFITMAVTVFLFGFLMPVIPMSVHKTCGLWFSSRQLGFANGIVAMGMALGFMLGAMISATFLSPWLGGWRNVLLLYGVISIALSIPWALSRRAPNDAGALTGDDTRPLRRTLAHVLRLKNIWLLGWAILGIGGCVQGMLGYLPLYLRGIGWPPEAADGALATFHAVSMLAVIPIALLSDRLGTRRRVLMSADIMIIIGVSLLSVVTGPLVWVAVLMAGFVRDGFMAVYMTMAIEFKGVGAVYASTAIGVLLIFSGLGNLIAPPVGNSLARIDPSLPFVFWASMAAAGFIGLYLTRENRTKVAPNN